MRSCSDKATLTICLEDDSEDQLTFIFDDSCCTTTLSLALLDLETDVMNIPEYIPDSSIKFHTKKLTKIFKNISIYLPDSIQFKSKNSSLYLKSITDDATIKIRFKEIEKLPKPKFKINNKSVKPITEFKIDIEKNVRGKYPFEQMNTFIQSIMTPYTTIYISNDFPIYFNCDLKNNSNLKYYLSPKINE